MIIQARKLRKRFRVRERTTGVVGALRGMLLPRWRAVTAVDDIDLDVEAGEAVAFIGPNGAGKSTTIKLLTGILQRDAGAVSVLGHDPQRQRPAAGLPPGARCSGRSRSSGSTCRRSTPSSCWPTSTTWSRAGRGSASPRWTEVFDIGRHLTTPVRKLSLGERIRCEIVASLIHAPELLFLDEPTIGLDVVIRQRIRDLIARVNRERGVTVFLTSHDTGDVEQVCRRAVVINHGRIVWDGAIAELKRSLLTTRIMDLKLAGPLMLDRQDVTVRDATRYSARLELDTARTRVEAVVRAILERNTVLDITIADPPLEEVIAALYGSAGNRREMGRRGRPTSDDHRHGGGNQRQVGGDP